jgi:hypothetical protein
MQQRRGTAAQWISTHNGDGPILNAGEIGFETDTGKFKIGDGTNHWVDLDYFLDESDIDSITGDYVLSSTLGQNNGVATLDGSGKLTSSQIPNIDEISQEAINTALVAGTGLDKTYDDNANTITLDIDSTVTTNSGSQTLTNKTISYADNTITVQVGNISDITATATELNYVDGVTSAIQTQLNTLDTDKADLASPTFTGTVTTDDLVVDGDFTVNGTNFAASATSIVIEDNIVQLAHQNPANTVDLGIVVGYNDGTAKHAGLVKDTSASTWKLFKDVTTEPTTTVDFTEGSLDDLAVAGLTASSITVGDVSNTEFGYLNGVTSSIQTQIDTKAPSSSPTISNPTVTGTLTAGGGTGTNGQYLKTTGTGIQWATVPSPSAATPSVSGTVFGVTDSATPFETSVGYQALTNSTGSYNTAIGYITLRDNTTGQYNTAAGWEASLLNNTGSFNTAMGAGALRSNTASSNTAFGSTALYFNTSGSDNTAMGKGALQANTTGENNTSVGLAALTANSTGSDNTAVGNQALDSNNIGINNSALGSEALQANTTGNNNTALGYRAGDAITTGSNLIVIGANADASSATATNEITIGDNAVTKFRIPGLGIDWTSASVPKAGADEIMVIMGAL